MVFGIFAFIIGMLSLYKDLHQVVAAFPQTPRRWLLR